MSQSNRMRPSPTEGVQKPVDCDHATLEVGLVLQDAVRAPAHASTLTLLGLGSDSSRAGLVPQCRQRHWVALTSAEPQCQTRRAAASRYASLLSYLVRDKFVHD